MRDNRQLLLCILRRYLRMWWLARNRPSPRSPMRDNPYWPKNDLAFSAVVVERPGAGGRRVFVEMMQGKSGEKLWREKGSVCGRRTRDRISSLSAADLVASLLLGPSGMRLSV